MREFNFEIEQSLQNGLRPKGVGRNAPFFDEMTNLIPWGMVARTPEPIDFYVEGLTLSGVWPFPQLLHNEGVTLLCDRTVVYDIDPSDWSSTQLVFKKSDAVEETSAPTNSTVYQLVAFREDGWFLCNGRSLFYDPPFTRTITNPLQYFTGDSAPVVRAIAKHDNRLFLGGLATSGTGWWWANARWQRVLARWKQVAPESIFVSENTSAPGNNWIVWSEPAGGADDMPFYVFLSMLGANFTTGFDKVNELIMAALESGLIGMLPLPVGGRIQRLVPFGNDLLAFTEEGICTIRRTQDGYYAAETMNDLSLPNAGAVASHGDEVVFLDSAGMLRRYYLEDRFFRSEQRDYADHVGSLTMANVQIARDPIRGHYYIGDGATGYVFTGAGLGGPIEVLPTTLCDFAGVKMGYTFDVGSDPRSIRLVSSPLDINERGKKRITVYQIASRGLSGVKGAVDYDYTNSGSFSRSPLKPANPEGVVFPRVSFADARVVIEGDVVDEEIGAQIERIEVRYQAEDKRYVRGTKGIAEEA